MVHGRTHREAHPGPKEDSWVGRAACAAFDTAVFFPDPEGDVETPLRICAGCPVRVECLDYALESKQRYGVWGGTTERERRRFLHRSA